MSWSKGTKQSVEHRWKNSLAQIGRKHTEETKAKMRKKRTTEQKEKYRLAAIVRSSNPTYIEKLRKYHLGRKLSKEVRSKIGAKSRGRRMPFRSEEYREKHRQIMISFWSDPINVKERVRTFHRRQNKLETKFQSLLDTRFPKEWKFVGDGQLIIGNKCPDFANINGKKALIELYGNYWHEGQNPQDRIDLFAKYGYQTLIIWENELKDASLVIERIRDTFYEKELV